MLGDGSGSTTTLLSMACRELVDELRRRISFPEGHADVWPLFYDAQLFGRILDALAEPLSQRVTKMRSAMCCSPFS